MFNSKIKLRVFIGPVEISGIAEALADGMSTFDVDAQVVLGFPHPFKYGTKAASVLVKMWQRIGAARMATTRDRMPLKILLVVAHSIWAWLVLMSVIARYDVFIFIFGQTITNTAFELWLLKRLDKKIIFVYVGSDSRPPYIDGALFPGPATGQLPSSATLLRSVNRCKCRIKLHERYADYLVNSSSTAHFHERPYINWFALGLPKTLTTSTQIPSRETLSTANLRILHCPSHPLAKGTAEITDAIERLQRKGYSIELVKIQGLPNDVVLQELALCDFIVDQLYSDTPMAAFATEAAFFGKPAVVGGYCADSIKQCFNLIDIPPSLFVSPNDLESAIERLVVDSSYRLQLGEQARQFVLTRWSPKAVAGRYLQLINDDVPSQWWCDPSEVRYLSGCGLPEERARQLVALLVSRFGPGSLQVQDKPWLEAALVEFSRVGDKQADA